MLTGNRSKHAKVSWGRSRRPFWSPQGQPGTAGETPHPLMSTQAEVTECAGPLGLSSAPTPHIPWNSWLCPAPAAPISSHLLLVFCALGCSLRASLPSAAAHVHLASNRAHHAGLLQKPEPLWPGLSLPPPPRHRGDWQRKTVAGCRRARTSSSAGWLSCLSFPRCGGQFQDVQGSEVPALGSWAGAGRGGRVVPGSQRGDTQGGRPWGVVWSCGRRTKQRHLPAVQANGMNGL